METGKIIDGLPKESKQDAVNKRIFSDDLDIFTRVWVQGEPFGKFECRQFLSYADAEKYLDYCEIAFALPNLERFGDFSKFVKHIEATRTNNRKLAFQTKSEFDKVKKELDRFIKEQNIK